MLDIATPPHATALGAPSRKNSLRRSRSHKGHPPRDPSKTRLSAFRIVFSWFVRIGWLRVLQGDSPFTCGANPPGYCARWGRNRKSQCGSSGHKRAFSGGMPPPGIPPGSTTQGSQRGKYNPYEDASAIRIFIIIIFFHIYFNVQSLLIYAYAFPHTSICLILVLIIIAFFCMYTPYHIRLRLSTY